MTHILMFTLAMIGMLESHAVLPVKMTAYSARACETDSTPNITASNKRVKEGYIALSRDIEKKFRLRFGDKVYVKGIGFFEFQDRMHRRKKRQIDIFMHSTKRALKFGVQKELILIEKRG